MTTIKTRANTIKPGDLMAFLTWVKVEDVKRDWNDRQYDLRVSALDHNNSQLEVRGTPLVESGYSADRFEKSEYKSRTEVAKVLENSNVPFTVCFTKKNGQKRVLRGRRISSEPHMGRSVVEDLDLIAQGDKHPVRQVDHRTLRYLIINGVEHCVKESEEEGWENE